MNHQKRDFDKEAAQWDNNPVRQKMTLDTVAFIKKQIAFTTSMEILDFGCGTGLLSVMLSPLVKSVTAVDSSKGMLDVLNKKIEHEKISNIKTCHVDLDNGDHLGGTYDCIFCTMTLHHIRDIQVLLGEFYHVLKVNGILCITDLDPENGLFHSDNTGVFHYGFEREDLGEKFLKAGLTGINAGTSVTISKPSAKDGEIREFTIFTMTGKKE